MNFDMSSIIWGWYQINVLDFVALFIVRCLLKSKTLTNRLDSVCMSIAFPINIIVLRDTWKQDKSNYSESKYSVELLSCKGWPAVRLAVVPKIGMSLVLLLVWSRRYGKKTSDIVYFHLSEYIHSAIWKVPKWLQRYLCRVFGFTVGTRVHIFHPNNSRGHFLTLHYK